MKQENDENSPKEMTAEEFKQKAANMLEKLEKEQAAEKKTIKSLKKVVNEDTERLKKYEKQLEIMGERKSMFVTVYGILISIRRSYELPAARS